MFNVSVNKENKYLSTQKQGIHTACIYLYIRKLLKFFLNKEKLFRDILKYLNPVKHIKKQAVFSAISIFFLLSN